MRKFQNVFPLRRSGKPSCCDKARVSLLKPRFIPAPSNDNKRKTVIELF